MGDMKGTELSVSKDRGGARGGFAKKLWKGWGQTMKGNVSGACVLAIMQEELGTTAGFLSHWVTF